ncbi:MAG: hypothetical protein D6732_23460 [Methanobacteriota archaeon]|nr:MAG: hypothetical protein D6732_23460 [Euryarchaeota archaeon]
MLKNILRTIAARIPGAGDIKDIRSTLKEMQEILGFLLNIELENHPRYNDPKRLCRYGASVNSQNYEDGIIQEIFRRIGVSDQVFVEIGVGDGLESNTAFLLSQGWTGFWIEANNRFLKTIQRYQLRDRVKYSVSFVTRENITDIFSELGIPKEFDLLSIDIDQNTFYIWEGLRRYRPRVVVVEYNAEIPPYIEWKAQYNPNRGWDGSKNFGASLMAFEKLALELGYSLVGCDLTGVNAFFVRNDLVGDKFCEPFTAENHYEPPRYYLRRVYGFRRSILDRNR